MTTSMEMTCTRVSRKPAGTPPVIPGMNTSMRWLAVMIGVVLSMAVLPGCESEADRLERIYVEATAKGRASASATLVKEWRAKKVTLNEAINLAYSRSETRQDSRSCQFAGAVLDAIETLDDELPHETLSSLFWYRVGGLAGQSAVVAFTLGDDRMARSLVLVGAERWQNDIYWIRHPAHDALTSYILLAVGEQQEAVRRLEGRIGNSIEVDEALEDIRARIAEARRREAEREPGGN
jgi:hypothetical protein